MESQGHVQAVPWTIDLLPCRIAISCFHSGRTVGGDRHHRPPGRLIAAGRPGRARGGSTHAVREPYQADGARVSQLRECARDVSTGPVDSRLGNLAGSFSDPNEPGRRHYWLAKYEISRLQWAAMTEKDCPKPSMRGRMPVTGVNWFEAVQYAQDYNIKAMKSFEAFLEN